MTSNSWLWGGFAVVVLGMLTLDLGVFNRRAHVITTREAAIWSAVWASVAAAFGLGIALLLGRQAALEYAAGYLVEEALSIDNLFVFILLFTYFHVPRTLQHRVLFWGILGALFMRGGMIAAGAALLDRFHWVVYVFGAFLVVTGVRLAVRGEEQLDPSHNPVLGLVRRLVPVTRDFRGPAFFVRDAPSPGAAARLMATPLFVVLVLVETTDLVFAVDSIPAIFGVTRDPFLVYTSNVFAILGLRSLFFLLAGVITKFHYLRYGLAAVLAFVGAKMLLSAKLPIPIVLSLAIIVGLLGASVAASVAWPERAPARPDDGAGEGEAASAPAAGGGEERAAAAAPSPPGGPGDAPS